MAGFRESKKNQLIASAPKNDYFCVMTKTELKFIFPSEYAEKIGFEYSNSTSNEHKKESGQFFTSKEISDFMGNLAQPKSDKISILDPGCGTAILSCSLIEKLIEKYSIKEIELNLFETEKYWNPNYRT